MLFVIRCTALLLFLAVPCLASGAFHNALSMQGFTGLLNTPNAQTTDEGKLYVSYSNQEDAKWRAKSTSQDNFMFSLGLFDLFEIGGRFFEAPDGSPESEAGGVGVGRDLSGNVKLRIPFLPKGEYLPTFAVGMQDIGGGAQYLRTKYAVASEEIGRFRFSVGYGTGPGRMKGLFGGVEVKACDWLYLLAENDTKENNVGIRLVTPHLFGYPVNLQVTAKSSLDHEPQHPEFALGLQFPLGLDHHYEKQIPVPAPATELPAAPQVSPQVQPAPTLLPPAGGGWEGGRPRLLKGDPLETLLKRLTADGFQNVRVGSLDSVLVIEYENARYNHNELDAIGVVTGIVQLEAPLRFETLRLIEKKKGIRIIQLEMPLTELRAFFLDASNLDRLQNALTVSHDPAETTGISFVEGDGNSSWLTAYLMLYPGLKNYVGTEVGAFDYLLSLKPDLYLNLWKGSVLNARVDIPFAWSDNFDDNRPFRSQRKGTELDRLMLFQGIKAAPTLMAVLGGGMVLPESYGVLNELLWTPGSGTHRVKFSQLYANNRERDDKDVEYLGSYRYYFAPLDLYLQGTAGKFLTKDRGFVGELKRFVGDTAVTFFVKNSVTSDGKSHRFGGIQFDLPLTPRRDMKPYPLQVRGSDGWSIGQETRIAKRNYVGAPIGSRLEPPFNVDRTFYNRDRLSEPYIRKHLLRLRDAYLRYVVPPES